MIVKIKKLHEKAVIPTYAKEGDAGMDLTATSIVKCDRFIEYQTGLAIEIPEGYFGLLRPRSSVSTKGLIFKTSGIIDSGYRGPLNVRFEDLEVPYSGEYEVGDRVAQLIILPYPKVEFQEVDELSESERGTGGYGSTGK